MMSPKYTWNYGMECTLKYTETFLEKEKVMVTVAFILLQRFFSPKDLYPRLVNG